MCLICPTFLESQDKRPSTLSNYLIKLDARLIRFDSDHKNQIPALSKGNVTKESS